jgi:transposase-like protein
MAIRKEILDELLKDYQKPEDLLGQSGLLQQLSKALIERGLDGEMTHHLGYEKHSPEGKNSVFLRQNGIGTFLWRRDARLPKEHQQLR